MSTVLEMTVNRWAEVIEENKRDRDLAEEDQLKQWDAFEAKTTARISEIIESYDGGDLKESDLAFLQDLEITIDRAKRVSREDLMAAKAEREEKERLRLEEEERKKAAELKKAEDLRLTKGRLLEKLGKSAN